MSPFMSLIRFRQHERGHLAEEEGQALVELALILPILVILVLGIVDFGKAYSYKNDETHLANAAGRYSSLNSFPAGFTGQNAIRDYVISTAPGELKNGSGSIKPPGVTITFTFTDGAAKHCKGDPVKVTVKAHYDWLHFLTLKGALPSPGADITSTATMRLEQSYDSATLTKNAYTPTVAATGGC
jgi:hypothetical protein